MRDIESIILKALLICTLLLPSAFAQTNAFIGKTKFVLGEVSIQKKSQGNWNPLRIGIKVKPVDLIRTLVESEAGIALNDGSLITIEENTTIHFEGAEASTKPGTSIKIKSGRVFFDVQKQSQGNTFQFKTETATAAIRGTNGFIEQTQKGIIASLETGKMVVTDMSGDSIELEGGETVIQDSGLKKFKNSGSGSRGLAKEISKELSDKSYNYDQMKKHLDSLEKEKFQRTDSLSKAAPCSLSPIPQKTFANELLILGHCRERVQLTVNSAPVEIDKNGNFSTTLSWESDTYGTKRIRAKCFADSTEILCGETSVEYAKPTPEEARGIFHFATPSPVKICDPAIATVEGQFYAADPKAELILSLGKSKSPNLAKKNQTGIFTYSFLISDLLGNWNEKFVYATFKTQSKTIKDSIAVDIDHSCPAVNKNAPKVKMLNADSSKCEFKFSLQNTFGERIKVTEIIDGVPAAELFYDEDTKEEPLPLLPKRHEYKLIAEDPANNHSESVQTFFCKE
ncbi:MAG: FecR family protein [Fibrobacteraceae bacterium]|nr:FecR family protein [Fibrobacteraceae bacterium]